MLGIEAEDEEYYQSADAIVERYVRFYSIWSICRLFRLKVVSDGNFFL